MVFSLASWCVRVIAWAVYLVLRFTAHLSRSNLLPMKRTQLTFLLAHDFLSRESFAVRFIYETVDFCCSHRWRMSETDVRLTAWEKCLSLKMHRGRICRPNAFSRRKCTLRYVVHSCALGEWEKNEWVSHAAACDSRTEIHLMVERAKKIVERKTMHEMLLFGKEIVRVKTCCVRAPNQVCVCVRVLSRLSLSLTHTLFAYLWNIKHCATWHFIHLQPPPLSSHKT